MSLIYSVLCGTLFTQESTEVWERTQNMFFKLGIIHIKHNHIRGRLHKNTGEGKGAKLHAVSVDISLELSEFW